MKYPVRNSFRWTVDLKVAALFFLFLAFSPGHLWANEEEAFDPLEGINRGIFWFNDKLDRAIIEPVARKYDERVPLPAQKGVSNFFSNLRFPAHFVSSIISLNFEDALTFTGRFLLNSTVGIAGLIDVAKDAGLDAPDTDIGAALGGWGMPAGPYLVLPILGPSNLRDGIGRGVEFAIDPLTIATRNIDSSKTSFYFSIGTGTVRAISQRAELIEVVEAAREASIDYYLFVRAAHNQNRHAMIRRARGEDLDDLDDQWLEDHDDF